MKHAFLFVAVALVAVPMGPSSIRANECYRTDAQVYSCDDPAFPICGFNPSRNEWLCIATDQILCAAIALTYPCPANQRCNGDGSAPPYCL